MKRAPIIAILVLSATASDAGDIPLCYVSPDRHLTAVIVPVGRDLGAKQIREDSEYECRVEIYDSQRHRMWSEDFGSPDHDHGRGVAFAAWSPDSHYFVFSTISSGGHHPWQYLTYVFDRQRTALRIIDDAVGPVVDPKFVFSHPDVVTLAVWDNHAAHAEAPNPTKQVSIALQKRWKKQ